MMNQAIREARETLGQFYWTTLQCNANTVSIPHRDTNNVGLSIIAGFGNYSQGELVLAGKLIDIRHSLIVFDGTQLHSSRPFSGDRYSAIAFTHGVIDCASDGHRKQLQLLGFDCPPAMWRGKQEPPRSDSVELAISLCRELPGGIAHGLRFLHLFSGPINRIDGFAAAIRAMGAECVEYDILMGEAGNLLDDEVWQGIAEELRNGRYDGKLGGPPCDSFSGARSGGVRDSGPRRLRGPEGPERYGLPDLRDKENIKVREGTLLAQRDASANSIMELLEAVRGSQNNRGKETGRSPCAS